MTDVIPDWGRVTKYSAREPVFEYWSGWKFAEFAYACGFLSGGEGSKGSFHGPESKKKEVEHPNRQREFPYDTHIEGNNKVCLLSKITSGDQLYLASCVANRAGKLFQNG